MVNLVLTHENEVLFLDNRGVEVLLAILRGNNTCISILFLNLIKLVIIDIRFQWLCKLYGLGNSHLTTSQNSAREVASGDPALQGAQMGGEFVVLPVHKELALMVLVNVSKNDICRREVKDNEGLQGITSTTLPYSSITFILIDRV